jgi:hypothetical protein
VSDPYPGARHDFILFQASSEQYKRFLEKEPGDELLTDPGRSQTSWALLADKGYSGAEAYVRALIPKKCTVARPHTPEELAYNQRLSTARVICENFYGRLKGLFKICTDRYRGKILYI